MKIIVAFLFFSIIVIGRLQAQSPISMDFVDNQKLRIRNNNDQFTYHVFVYRKGQRVDDFLVAPSSQKDYTYKFKRKRIAKQMSISYNYDEQAHNADKYNFLDKARIEDNKADNIANECWRKVRDEGWLPLLISCSFSKQFLEAVVVILSTGDKNPNEIRQLIRFIESELEKPYLSKDKKDCYLSALEYLKTLLLSIEDTFRQCPELEQKQQQYRSNAKYYRESIVAFDNKFGKERNRIKSMNIWEYAYDKHNLIPSFIGFGLEANQQSIFHNIEKIDANSKTELNIKILNESVRHPEFKAQIPLSRPFKGFLLSNPARLFVTTTFVEGGAIMASNNSDVFLGVKNVSDGSIRNIIDNNGKMKVNYSYQGLGIKYMYMPEPKIMWVSWELGAMTVQEKPLSVTANESFSIINNEIVNSQSNSFEENVNILAKNQLNAYFKFQLSFALFSLSNRLTYPYRKKIFLGANLEWLGFNNSNLDSSNELVQINTNNRKITEFNPIKIGNSSTSIGFGLNMYL